MLRYVFTIWWIYEFCFLFIVDLDSLYGEFEETFCKFVNTCFPNRGQKGCFSVQIEGGKAVSSWTFLSPARLILTIIEFNAAFYP